MSKYQPPSYSFIQPQWGEFKMSVGVCSICGSVVSRRDQDKHDEFHSGTWVLLKTLKRLFKK